MLPALNGQKRSETFLQASRFFIEIQHVQDKHVFKDPATMKKRRNATYYRAIRTKTCYLQNFLTL